jgi:putative sterol carrier protein
MVGMSVARLKSDIIEKLAAAPVIGARIAVDLGEDGTFWIDGMQNPAVLHDGPAPEAETTFICAPVVLQGIMDGTQDATLAYMTGKLKIQGSMGYALKLNSFLSD